MSLKISLKTTMVFVTTFALLLVLLKTVFHNPRLEKAISRLQSSKILDAQQEHEVFRELASQSSGLEISFAHLVDYQPRSSFPKAGDTIEIRVNGQTILHRLIDPQNLSELMLE